MRFRYHRTQQLLFLPGLIRRLRAKASVNAQLELTSESLASAAGHAACQLCLTSARQQIDVCYDTIGEQYDAPWYRRFCKPHRSHTEAAESLTSFELSSRHVQVPGYTSSVQDLSKRAGSGNLPSLLGQGDPGL